mgnify:FL=1
MKRMLGFFMALLLFAVPAIAQGAMVEGDWELISIVIEGTTYENLAQQGLVMTMRLEADGTGVQTVNDEVYPCTWTESDGKILVEDADGSMSYVLQADGTLLGEDAAGDTMTFARAAADSVAGAWELTAAEADGIIITDTSTLDVELSLLLDADGTGMLTSSEGEGACTWTQSGSTVTVMVENGESCSFTLQPDGTLTWVLNDVTLVLSHTDDAAAAMASEPSESAAIVSDYGFSVRLPEGWLAVDSEYVTQIVASVGEEIASANGIDQSLLDQLAAANTSLYCAADASANFNVVREPAGDVTMDNFALLESHYQEMLSSQGIADFELSGPVDINGTSYYVGTFTAQAGLKQKQYFCVANGYIYTLTLTNVTDSDAEEIMQSFEIL